ncbi:sugar phosphate isomerase/epimerase family protein [Tunturiibacter lichenicola]|uniref:sugar phosphate isomerase/epimerase family protein n=1 Tax=Tunturiibacter lichenicola TaxID=2051959 RepID=UPI003D9B082F
MYPAIFTRTYPITNTADVLFAVTQDGYAGVQFNLLSAGLASLPESLPDGLAEEVANFARSNGLFIAALSGTYNMAHPDSTVRLASRVGFANVVKAAHRMGAPVVTLCTGSRNESDMWQHHPDNDTPAAWHDLRTELDYALGLADVTGVKLAVEPEPGNVICDATAARRLLDEVASPHLGIVLDAANLLSPENLTHQRTVISHAVELLSDSILLAHAKDINASGQVVAAGDGAVDLPAFVAALRSASYDGALIGHGFSVEKTRDVAKFLTHLVETTS